jgi:hypothetical protein
MRTGARRVAGFEVIQQRALFLARKSLSAFDSQPLADTRSKFRFDFCLQRSLVFFEIFHQSTKRK